MLLGMERSLNKMNPKKTAMIIKKLTSFNRNEDATH